LNSGVPWRARAARSARCCGWGRRVSRRGPRAARVQRARAGQAAQSARPKRTVITALAKGSRVSAHPTLAQPCGQTTRRASHSTAKQATSKGHCCTRLVMLK